MSAKPLAIIACLTAISLNFLSTHKATGCTDFQIETTGNNVIVGRSMEWGLNLKSHIRVQPRGQERVSQTPDGKSGVSWKSKYGFVGIDSNGMDVTVDGLNEKGLSLGCLWLPGTTYQDVAYNQADKAINVTDLGTWILGNFATTEEVKTAIGDIRVWAKPVAECGGIPTMHLALHDATGASAVVEFINGEQKIYDNPNGVLTNAPTFDWHRINLRNYVHLSARNAQPIELKGSVLAPPGQGSGFLGIPGDWTPPSRFVRTTAMLAFAKPVSTAKEAVNLAQHILNAVDIPIGDISDKQGNVEHNDYTQWIVVKDLTNKITYFRSYDNLTLRAIDLNRLDFAEGSKVKIMPIAGGEAIVDTTAHIRQ